MTPGQVDAVHAAAVGILARWPHEDLADTREIALSAATQVIVGDNDLAAIAHVWQAARRVERDRMAALTGAIIAAAATTPEAQIADTARVDRMTVRKALNKQ